MSSAAPPPAGESSGGAGHGEEPQNIATAIAEVSERATLLVREEIELAKAEMREKVSRLLKGAVVGIAAGVFFFTALAFALAGCAWLLYYYLPVGNQFTYFWGFFAMAVILVALGALAGLIAARAVKRGSPPVPNMAIEEARKIRESVGREQAGEAMAGAQDGAPSAARPDAQAPGEPAGPSTGAEVGG